MGIKEKKKESNFIELIRHTKNYFLGAIAIKAIGFISLPVMTRILTPKDYGTINVFYSYISIFSTILTLNCYVALGRYFFEKENDFEDFFGTLIVFISALLSLFFGIFIIFKKDISKIIELPETTIIYIVPLVLFFSFSSWYEQLAISRKKSKQLALRNILQAYITFTISVVMILILANNKYMGQIYSMTIVGFCFFIYYLVVLKPDFKISFKLKHIKYMLEYSIPLIPYSLSGIILAQFDRMMINKSVGATDAGLYSFAYNIGFLLTVVVSSINQAWMPDYYKAMDEKNYDKLNKDVEKIFTIIIVSAISLIFFGKELGMILGAKSFHTAIVIVPIIIIGYVFNSIFAYYGWSIGYFKKNIYLSVAVLLAGVINIILNLIFIPKYGYMAAAYNTSVSYFFMALFAWISNKFVLKLYSIPIVILLKPLCFLAGSTILYYFISSFNFNFFEAILIKLFVISILVFLFLRKMISKIMNKAN